jgi:hypothetical protein
VSAPEGIPDAIPCSVCGKPAQLTEPQRETLRRLQALHPGDPGFQIAGATCSAACHEEWLAVAAERKRWEVT